MSFLKVSNQQVKLDLIINKDTSTINKQINKNKLL